MRRAPQADDRASSRKFARFLIEHGIDSISLNSDTVLKTPLAIVEKEKTLGDVQPGDALPQPGGPEAKERRTLRGSGPCV